MSSSFKLRILMYVCKYISTYIHSLPFQQLIMLLIIKYLLCNLILTFFQFKFRTMHSGGYIRIHQDAK